MATKGNKNKKIEATEAQAVLDSVKGVNLQSVIAEVGTLQVSVQESLANLSGALSSKIQEMQNLDTAISLKNVRLKELHNIESEAVTLDDMKAQRDAEQVEWNSQRNERDQEWDDEENERNRRLKRAEDEYTYNFEQIKKKQYDEFDAEMNKRKRDEALRSETLERSWKERDAALRAKETEFTALQAQVAGFDAKLKTEVSKAEAVLGNVLKKQYEHETALLKKDVEADKNLHQIRVSAMDETITSLQEQIKDLQTQLAQARSDAKDVASQALQSASGRDVAVALQRVVDTGVNAPVKTK
jgi:chromosome segregation ATPase